MLENTELVKVETKKAVSKEEQIYIAERALISAKKNGDAVLLKQAKAHLAKVKKSEGVIRNVGTEDYSVTVDNKNALPMETVTTICKQLQKSGETLPKTHAEKLAYILGKVKNGEISARVINDFKVSGINWQVHSLNKSFMELLKETQAKTDAEKTETETKE